MQALRLLACLLHRAQPQPRPVGWPQGPRWAAAPLFWRPERKRGTPT
jgi:hypothetical protein